MANIEKITYKGDVYDISDAKAMHQDAAGSWMPDFDALKPIETHEWTIATTATGVICERANFTNINDARDVLAFRITVDASSGTSIHQVADVIVRLQPTANTTPLVMVINRSRSTSSATTGFRYLYTVYPKAANTNYKYQLAIYPYNATSRKVKVEVFKKTDDWTFKDSRTAYSYNSDYQTRNDMTIYTSLGVICNYTQYMTTSYSNYAGYVSSWLPYFNSSYSELTTGAAVSASQLCFIGEDGKAYPASNTTAAIDTAYPPFYASNEVSNATAMTWSYVRRFGVVTIPTSIGRDTLAAGKPVYMRCTNSNGKVYSANKITHDLTTGYTYVKIGRMHSSTVTCFDTYNSQYFTVNNDRITRLNNIPLEAELAAAIDRQLYISQTGNYGVLLDNNQITDLTTPTMSPKVAGTLTFNPSTGNLSSTLFTGSGAGLTNVPADELTGVVPLANGGTGLNAGVADWYSNIVLHPRFVIYYDSINGGFNIVYHGPLDGINSIEAFASSEYYKAACRATAVIIADNTYPIGTATVMSTIFDGGSVFELAFLFPDSVSFGGYTVNGLRGALVYDANDGVYLDPLTVQPNSPRWKLATDDIESALLGKENTSNKVTSIDSTSDDDQYPSAKCVYDAISAISPGGGAGDDCYYGYCSASASSANKVVTINNVGYTIKNHVRLFVYFENPHTYSSTKPYLSIDGTTYAIRYYDTNGTAVNGLGNVNSILSGRRYMEFHIMTLSGSLQAIALPPALPTLYSTSRTSNARITSLNQSTADGAYLRYWVASTNSVTTGIPKINGSNVGATVIHMNWDSGALYATQIAVQIGDTSGQGGMAYRRQNGTTNGWNDWKTLADEDNIGTLTDVEHCYTATLTPAGDGTVVFPIDGTKYKITQITLMNFDLNATAGFGMSRIFVANNGGTGGYMLESTDYFGLASTSTDITMSIAASSSSGMQNSTNLHVQVRYVKL